MALPRKLIDDAAEVAPEELRSNFNRLVRTALEEFVRARRRSEFEEAMRAMARDPAIVAENRGIQQEFEATEMDGLDDGR